MDFDLVIRNARLADGAAAGATVDIAIADGHIAAIEPRISGNGENVDAGGHLVSPGLVESHFHLDKARILDRCSWYASTQTMRAAARILIEPYI